MVTSLSAVKPFCSRMKTMLPGCFSATKRLNSCHVRTLMCPSSGVCAEAASDSFFSDISVSLGVYGFLAG